MPAAKLVIIYPVPKDPEAFERIYHDQHVPMAVNKLAGKTKIVVTKILSSAQGGAAPFHRIAEIDFPSMSVLQACAASYDVGSRPYIRDISGLCTTNG
jgi:uncharacterized protein (TIGR02118 family)